MSADATATSLRTSDASPASRRISPLSARVILLLLAVLLVVGGTTSIATPPPAPTFIVKAGINDTALFEGVIAQLREGHPYYDTLGTEMRRQYYPAASVFNWRFPLLFELLAAIGLRAGWWLLATLCLAALILAIPLFEKNVGPVATVVGVVMMIGAFLVVLSRVMLVHAEGWCGVLLLLSVLVFARGQHQTGALLGITALFVRELAALYCVVGAVAAWHSGRRREFLVWCAGITAYLLAYAVHATNVLAHQRPSDLAFADSWLRWGGLPFLLETMQQCNSVLLHRPNILSVVALVMASAALTTQKLPVHAKGIVAIYSVFFLAVGYRFNDYWGLVVAPTLGLSTAFGIAATLALVKAAGPFQNVAS